MAILLLVYSLLYSAVVRLHHMQARPTTF